MKRFWVTTTNGEKITGPFDYQTGAEMCKRALERETGGSYEVS